MSHHTYPYDLWNTPDHLLTQEQRQQKELDMQKSKINPLIPRRAQMKEWTEEEKEIQLIVWKIEKLGASTKLTKAINLLAEAKEALADHVEGIE